MKTKTDTEVEDVERLLRADVRVLKTFIQCFNLESWFVKLEDEFFASLQEEDKEVCIFNLLENFVPFLNMIGTNEESQTSNTEEIQTQLREQVVGFGRELDATLLRQGVNLLYYEELAGIDITLYGHESRAECLQNYIKTVKLAQYYIDKSKPELCATTQTKTRETDENELTEHELSFFEEGIRLGYMEETETGYHWLYGNRGDKTCKARLAYFVSLIYNYGTPWKKFETLFGVTRLQSSYNLLASKRANEKLPWQLKMEADLAKAN